MDIALAEEWTKELTKMYKELESEELKKKQEPRKAKENRVIKHWIIGLIMLVVGILFFVVLIVGFFLR